MLHIRISLCIKFNLMYLSLCIFVSSNFEFLDEICPRKIFMVKNRKIEHHHWIPLIQISLGTTFHLKLAILTRFTQKGFFWSKTEVNTTHFPYNSAYSNYSSAEFQLKLTIFIFWIKFAQKGIPGLKLKTLTSSLNFICSN